MRSQTEVRNMLLETGGEAALVTKWQRAWLNCVLVFWNIELLSDDIGYLAEEISQQSVEGMDWFLLSAYSKM